MYRVKQIETGVNLAGFSRWLSQQGVAHRITVEGNYQVLWLEHADNADPVTAALERFLAEPELRARVEEVAHSPVFVGGRWQPAPKHAPLVLVIIALAGLLAWVTGLGSNMASAALMMVDPRYYDWSTLPARMTALADTLARGQIWRLLSPDFLHFSMAHIIFNSVMLWFLGSQVEWFDGKSRVLVLFVVTSLLANGLQYMVSGPLFGGLSGVVYGLLGYCWLSQQRRARFHFPPALVIFSVVWMVIGFTPLPEWLGIGRMANEAHLGGFVAGLLVAVLWAPSARRRDAGP
ncbi:rhomboid family intramembrane serine protease [Marinobacter sp. X15-166B]|uniref:rhomboid family intramembrane serine protease n=1 Tax=Marinobacter sp. X15-166B TaxID=1897620 RepID=UPI00085BD698|nr:rhomboid family intramembrane serine protease [Marinobacter sp. X15-166B]OEY66971.1 rhomboid family intramembrane serine protease [Marinobacter sp. X15-166B]